MNQESKQDLCDSITEQVTKLCRQKLTESPDFKMDAVVKLSVGGEDFVIQITKQVNNDDAEEKNDEPEEIGAVMIKNEVLDNSIFVEKENEEDGEKTPTKKIRPEVKMHKCEECEETFTSHAKLRKHRIAQHKQRAFECSECGKTFNKRSVLDRHLIIHEPVKNFSCAVCSKQFRDQRSLDEHSSVHTGEKPFQCPHCSRFFRLKKNMRLHMRIHTGERPYLCALCAKSFRRSEDFRAHMHTHNRDQRFTCEVCGNAFGYRASLRRHMKAHNTEKAFSCEYCGKSFHRRDRLNGHLRVHTGEKPYQCDECGKCFKERTHLRTHCRLLHSDDAQKKNKRNYSVTPSNPQILDRIQAVHVVEQDKSGVTRLKPIEITTSNTGEEVYGQPVTVTYTQMKKDNSVSEVAVNETPLQITTDYTSANLHYQCGGCGYMYSSKSEFEQHVQQCMGISQASLTVSDQVLLLQQIGN